MRTVMAYLSDWYWSGVGITYPYWRRRSHKLLETYPEET